MNVENETYNYMMSSLMPMGWANFSYAMNRLHYLKDMDSVVFWIQVGHVDPVSGKEVRYDDEWETGDSPLTRVGHEIYRLFNIGGTARQIMHCCSYDAHSGHLTLALVDKLGECKYNFPALSVSRIGTRKGSDETFESCVINPTVPAQRGSEGEVISPYLVYENMKAITLGAPIH